MGQGNPSGRAPCSGRESLTRRLSALCRGGGRSGGRRVAGLRTEVPSTRPLFGLCSLVTTAIAGSRRKTSAKVGTNDAGDCAVTVSPPRLTSKVVRVADQADQ